MTPAEEFLESLKNFDLIDEGETFKSLFQKPYKELMEIFESLINVLVTIPQPFSVFMIGGLSMMIEESKEKLKSEKSKANANRIFKLLQNKAFIALNPLIFSFLQWDYNRRVDADVWQEKRNDFKYKKEYIKETISKIEIELQGASRTIASKYFPLIVEFLEDFMNNKIPDTAVNEFKPKWQEQHYKNLNLISEMLKNGDIYEIVDEELENTISNEISEKSQSIKKGLRVFSQQFDFISNAFVHALIDYKYILSMS